VTSKPTCPGCGQLVDVTYDGPRVELRPQPWRGGLWHAGCAVRAFRAILWRITLALLAIAAVLLLVPMPWKLAAILPGLAGLFGLLLVTVGPPWARETRP
jgi:hypothetical protein